MSKCMNKKSLSIVAGFTALLAVAALPQLTISSDRSSISVVWVVDHKGSNVELMSLERTAREHLRNRAPEAFKNINLSVGAFVSCSRNGGTVRFLFSGDPGERVYNLTYALDGSLQRYETHLPGADAKDGNAMP